MRDRQINNPRRSAPTPRAAAFVPPSPFRARLSWPKSDSPIRRLDPPPLCQISKRTHRDVPTPPSFTPPRTKAHHPRAPVAKRTHSAPRTQHSGLSTLHAPAHQGAPSTRNAQNEPMCHPVPPAKTGHESRRVKQTHRPPFPRQKPRFRPPASKTNPPKPALIPLFMFHVFMSSRFPSPPTTAPPRTGCSGP